MDWSGLAELHELYCGRLARLIRCAVRQPCHLPSRPPQAIVKLGEGFNGADMRNICTEAGLFAIRAERDYVVQEDFMKVGGALGVGGAVWRLADEGAAGALVWADCAS